MVTRFHHAPADAGASRIRAGRLTTRSVTRALLLALSAAGFSIASGGAPAAQTAAGEWRHYGGNAASHKHSPLDQIAPSTVGRLRVAWRWPSPDNAVAEANPSLRPGAYQDTPLMVRGVLYTVTSLGQIAAIDPASGATRWIFDPRTWEAGRPGNLGFVHRGLAYWSDGARERLFLGTGQAYLLAVDARTGRLDPAFGDGGRVDLMDGVARAVRGCGLVIHSAAHVHIGWTGLAVARDINVLGTANVNYTMNQWYFVLGYWGAGTVHAFLYDGQFTPLAYVTGQQTAQHPFTSGGISFRGFGTNAWYVWDSITKFGAGGSPGMPRPPETPTSLPPIPDGLGTSLYISITNRP